MTNLLPPNSSKLERALAACTADIERVNIPLSTIWNPNTCPVSLLPYLAWALSVDRWEESWPEPLKRQTVSTAYAIHKNKGTIAALRNALAPHGYSMDIVEWWQDEEQLSAGEFALNVRLSGQGISPETNAEVERLIDEIKPVSRHLKTVNLQEDIEFLAHRLAAVVMGDILTVYPIPQSLYSGQITYNGQQTYGAI